jgi:Zn-dependent protease with chaperone function
MEPIMITTIFGAVTTIAIACGGLINAAQPALAEERAIACELGRIVSVLQRERFQLTDEREQRTYDMLAFDAAVASIPEIVEDNIDCVRQRFTQMYDVQGAMIPFSKEQAPTLYAMVADMAKRLQCSVPLMCIDTELNFGETEAMHNPAWCGISTDIIRIGYGTFKRLDDRMARCVLAHEFGHFKICMKLPTWRLLGFGVLALMVIRAGVMRAYETGEFGVLRFMMQFLAVSVGYIWFCRNILSSKAPDQHEAEKEADQFAIELVGPAVFIETMQRLRSIASEIFEEQYNPTSGAIATTLRVLEATDPAAAERFRMNLGGSVTSFRDAMELLDGSSDMHPTFAVRIAMAEQWKKNH